MIGDGLLKPDGTFWLQALVSKGPKLAPNDLKQQAATPLASFLRFDPWTDQVIAMRTTYEPLLSSRDKMPFEITPVYLKLSYWKPAPPPPPPAGDAAAATPADAAAVPAGPPLPRQQFPTQRRNLKPRTRPQPPHRHLNRTKHGSLALLSLLYPPHPVQDGVRRFNHTRREANILAPFAIDSLRRVPRLR